METEVFNLWYLLFVILTFIVILFAVVFGFQQLRQIKLTRDLEFMRVFNERLLEADHRENRKYIYNNVSHPKENIERLRNWLLDSESESTKQDAFFKVENELYEFNRMGLYLRKGKIDTEIGLDIWFDVLARFTVLLPEWISRERERRGKDYLVNLIWLLRENYKYIANFRSDTPIRLKFRMPFAEDIVQDVSYLDIKLEDIEDGLKRLNRNWKDIFKEYEE